MNKITACIVAHNEEKIIERCLKSFSDIVDEIIIVHDGDCNDKTLEICKKYTNKIYIGKFFGYAEPHRIFCLRKAMGPWILQIDADEFLSKGLKEQIKNLISSDDFDGYKFFWPMWDGSRYLTKKWPYKLGLYKKSKVSYIANIHSVPEINGKIGKSSLILEHRPSYNNFTWSIFRKKWIKWGKIHAQIYLNNLRDVEKFNYKKNDWPKIVQLRKKYPVLLMPFDFIVAFFKNLVSGGYREGIFGYKYSFMIALYRVYVNYYIFIIKIKKRVCQKN